MPDISPDLPFSISLRRVNQCVGYVALLLPLALVALTLLGGLCFRASISHYYFSRLGGDLFVGALVFVGLLLAAFYDFEPQETEGCLQHRWYDLWLVRLAGICALGVAFVPTADSGCAYQPSDVARVFLTQPQGSETASVPGGRVTGTISHDFWASFEGLGGGDTVPVALRMLHVSMAGVMLVILAYYAFFVFTRGNSSASSGPVPPGSRKALRNRCYRVLGLAIALSVAAIATKTGCVNWLLSATQAQRLDAWWDARRLTFVLETIALGSFGLSWLIKGRFISLLKDEGP
ncbi:hypothetical protein [Sedimentitalea nanhaiensis]|uniref:Uncharacterized protein n=1 Tax=Sedimentitalea nanhaiensis TaxID=999627 RepID=A0A1I7B112_9RHOB|nr:hypothetical protein [Sedimentitalea nanhaiensis]SFT80890.1 hypothetical protein SAMN05216236_10871 [Sedimentitalea nanhaiensis]